MPYLINPNEMRKKTIRRVFAAVVCLASAWALVYVLSWNFGDSFVFLLVQESSSAALSAWPLCYDKPPQAIVDLDSKKMILSRKKSLFGVELGVYHLVFSDGIQISDTLYLSRTGRETLDLDRPISIETVDPQGRVMQVVRNEARILPSSLRVLQTRKDGSLELHYGEKNLILAPGESYAQLLVRTEKGIQEITAEEASKKIDECLSEGYPITRLVFFNCGFFPKANVKAGEGL